MAQYKLTEWEHNGLDDSDWYAVVYDSDKDQLDRILINTTRGYITRPSMKEPTDEIYLKAEAKLSEIIFKTIKNAEENDVLRPNALENGARISFITSHAAQKKEFDQEPCGKCKGTGHWVNPNNNKDKRECFNCNGTGQMRTRWRPLRECKKCGFKFSIYINKYETEKPDIKCPKCQSKKHKIIRDKVEAGATGTIIRTQSFGQFYRKGYNRPGRNNTSAVIRLDDCREVMAPLEKLRLEREMLTDEQLLERAERLSKHRNFYEPFRTAVVRL